MSWTSIHYRDKQFLANDLLIEVWMLEVVHQMDSNEDLDPWLDEVREEWRLQATAGFGFGPTPTLDKYVDTTAKRLSLLKYFAMALNAITLKGESISATDLAESGVGGPTVIYTQGIPTAMVIEVGRQFIALLD